ncbi:MAG: DJ-1/PfpI family protein [Cyclobacteriaceae bacterium]|nr:DJ-1/PfpI family protein [Cyclobacteriaceae bacterium]
MKSLAIVLFDEVEVLDFAGPFEVFSVTGRRKIREPYEVFTVAERKTVTARNNLVIAPTYTLSDCPSCSMFLVPGGGGFHADGTPFGSRREMHNQVLLHWIRDRAAKADHVLSVCTGALILAKAGLLENLEATTHFLAVDQLASLSGNIRVSGEKRWVDNGKVILSAGVSAGIDMSLHMVERLQGVDMANETAKYMQYEYWDQGRKSVE